MSHSVTSIIIRREYMERVTKKSFIVTTILVPILMLVLALLPTAIMLFATGDTKTIAVVDDSGLILPNLQSTDDVKFIDAWAPQDQMLSNDSIYGVLVIDRNIIKRNSGLKLLTPNAASVNIEAEITGQVEKIIETEKLKAYDIENLDEILSEINTDVTLQTIRTDESGEEGESQSAAISSAIGTILNFVLYMFLLMYGSLVMNSIIEEKNNRVLEIVVSSINPRSLMLGKIVGVGLVALTQIAIWAIIMFGITTLLLPSLIPADVMAEAQSINSGTADMASVAMDSDIAMALGMFTNVGFVMKIMGLMLLFLIGGYLIYASIFAAIGASVDNIQDASQLQTIGIIPIFIGLFSSLAVIADPNSTFAMVMSLIPFTSPMVMMARVPFDVPGWQIWLSLALLYLTIIFMIWLAAKIYRIGIFMYGKKPTFKDLIRWARYK
ncbi:MAG: ABC transporter permease [Muribaculaceae bacterium]|nr:ABC transporter permease [Muribaculaceae bacterium]